MEKSKEIKNFNVKIARIKEIFFQCNELDDKIINQLNEKLISVGLGLRINPNSLTEELGIALKINYVFHKDALKVELCAYEVECFFQIIEFKQVVKIQKDRINIDDGLLANLLSITIGTVRGMLSLKTSGTALNKYPLPLLNAVEILKQLKPQPIKK